MATLTAAKRWVTDDRQARRRSTLQKMMPRGLFWRSLLIVVVPLLILQVVLAYVFYERHWETVTRWLAIGVSGEVAYISEELEMAETLAERRAVLDRARRHNGFALSLEPDGILRQATQTVGFLPPSRLDSLLRKTFEDALGERPFAIDTRPEQVKRIVVYVQLENGLLRVVAPRKRVDSPTTRTLLAWMVGVALLLIAIAIFFLRRQIRPIRRLAQAADSFGKGRDIGDFKLEGAVEIRRAGLAFNRMRQRILRQIVQRTEMLAAVSHDLSTPLTRMRLELEMLSETKASAAMQGLRDDVAEMERLIEAYLAFARGEGQETILPVQLSQLFQQIERRAARNGQNVAIKINPDGAVPIRPLAMQRVLTNLLDNACRYGTRAWLHASVGDDLAVIVIDDDGPGIPPEKYQFVFQPFQRLESSRSQRTGGVGLGLTTSKDTVLAHGGTIALGEAPTGGLRVTITLPL
ncbi:MAG: ATP-binding protein [Geminicoccaceae bacterium]